MNSKMLAVGIMTAAFSHTSMAEDNSKVAKALAERYIGTLGCSVEKVGPRNIARITDSGSNSESNLNSYYVAAVESDLQCAGGSGTSAAHLVVVGNAEMDYRSMDGAQRAEDLRVRPELSAPAVATVGAPRAITSLYIKDGQLQATGLEYSSSDANCCPSLKTIYKVQLVKKDVQVGKDDKRPANTWLFTKIKNYQ
ncbi:hypothetical protein LMG23992_00339 [Cupriavidus laharis]|uniref:Uncharacterized protein n=1 Tax=Cupriavidus laharis TaxID=151654 RepID=A0ABM8WD09_9BURK|nr:hypothetical protein [Cupriavidus laharis]CAG9165195.1 hypothetical protein LMG23992_00339 [Cupriavidus laharis]